MNHTPQDLRTQTLELINAAGNAGNAAAPVVQLVQAWLDSLDAEDLADIAPDSLAPVLVDGFTQAAKRAGNGCQIATLRYADGRGGMASALLILNEDMPYLVDSIVMAMRRQHLAVRGVMNTVLPVRRAADGSVEAVRQPGDPLESYVLVLLDEELAP
ncbi:MAG: NAD-glutamate dehydrogenase, partial [Janthinobacterium sp.]